jgi:hypothetical protein
MGMLGGAMSATFAIQKLRSTPTPIPIDLQVSLAFLKLPAGALTAIGGLVLIHGQFIPGLSDLDSQGQILAYAIVLGSSTRRPKTCWPPSPARGADPRVRRDKAQKPRQQAKRHRP